MKQHKIGLGIAFGVALGIAASALAQQASGYARFSQTSDTIRIFGNTAFNGVDSTYEMRIRVAPSATGTLGQVLSEQRDAYESKMVKLSNSYFMKDTSRGYGCTDFNSHEIGVLPLSNWRHIAWVRQGPNARLYLDGELVMTWTGQLNCSSDYADSTMSLGMFRNGSPCCWGGALPSFLGDLDWIRVSSGAIYTSNFTPPLECEVTATASTQLLLKFNEPAGTTTLFDESASGFRCELGLAVYPGVTATSPSLGNTADGFPACGTPCTSDIDENGVTDGIDLAVILGRWGTNPKDYPRADANGDGIVDANDLAIVLSGWGSCPD